MSTHELMENQADRIEQLLNAKKLPVRVVGGNMGHTLAVYQAIKPAAVGLGAIKRQEEEIALALGAASCRIGRCGGYLTFQIPRKDPLTVEFSQLHKRVPEGRPGAPVIGVDEEDIPLILSLPSDNVAHVLISGTTGSGKTELARVMIAGLAKASPTRELGLILIDPKRRGYQPFAGLPHLVYPVVSALEEALGVLTWLVKEMERRDREGIDAARLVVFIDELADLMLTGGQQVEEALTRLVQRGREAKIHVVACAQKPTAAVIGSLIKANFPARIVGRVTDTNDAYVASGISGTGAERLLGKGDFLIVVGGEVTRMQGAYISQEEICELVTGLRGGRAVNGRVQGSKRVLDFVERFRERQESEAGAGDEPVNKKAPTDAMIEFALGELEDHGEVSQRAVQRFHQREYGKLCNTRRAQAAIDAAVQRRNGATERGLSG